MERPTMCVCMYVHMYMYINSFYLMQHKGVAIARETLLLKKFPGTQHTHASEHWHTYMYHTYAHHIHTHIKTTF